MLKKSFLMVLSVSLLLEVTLAGAGSWKSAAAPVAPKVRSPVSAEACKALENTDFSRIQDAPTQVMKARMVEVDGELPAYCHV